jgi:hypothetical protein
MRTSIWYRTELKNPDHSGYYFAYRGWGMGGKADGDCDYGYLYYDRYRDRWREYERDNKYDSVIVYYWTDADPHGWVEKDPPSVKIREMKEKYNPTLEDAWQRVKEAIDQYNMIKNLIQ